MKKKQMKNKTSHYLKLSLLGTLLMVFIVIIIYEAFRNPLLSLDPPATKEELSKFKIYTDGDHWYLSEGWQDMFGPAQWFSSYLQYDSSNACLEIIAMQIKDDRKHVAEHSKIEAEEQLAAYQLQHISQLADQAPTLSDSIPLTPFELQSLIASNRDYAHIANLMTSNFVLQTSNELERRINELQESKQDKPKPTNDYSWILPFVTNGMFMTNSLTNVISKPDMIITNDLYTNAIIVKPSGVYFHNYIR